VPSNSAQVKTIMGSQGGALGTSMAGSAASTFGCIESCSILSMPTNGGTMEDSP
jgi:hypothetical protein